MVRSAPGSALRAASCDDERAEIAGEGGTTSDEEARNSDAGSARAGSWPSFISGIKRLRDEHHDERVNGVANDLLGQLEHSYETRRGYWKGGTVSVYGYGGGIIPRFSEDRSAVPEVARVPHPAGPAAGRQLLHHRHAAKARGLLGEVGVGARHLPRADRQHHVHRRQYREHPAFLRRYQRLRLRPGRRRPLRAHRAVVRRIRPLRAVLRQRAQDPPLAGEQLRRRHPSPGAALQVQVQGLRLSQRLHELHRAGRLRGDRHVARRDEGGPGRGQGLRRAQGTQVPHRQRHHPMPDERALAERRRHHRGRRPQLRAVHALPERDAEVLVAWRREGGIGPHRRQAHAQDRRPVRHRGGAVHEARYPGGLRPPGGGSRRRPSTSSPRTRWSTNGSGR